MENIYCEKGCCNLKTLNKNIKKNKGMHYPFEKRKAGVVIWCKGKVLLTQSHNNYWGIPKGQVEPSDKNIKSCAERELKEETGLNITLKDYELYKVILDHNYIYKISIEDMDSINLENLPILDSTGIGWVYPDCARSLNLNFLTRKLLL
jgi:8-oxo-dGTP pyrophosphatase MutT (NUDIX family)